MVEIPKTLISILAKANFQHFKISLDYNLA